MTIYQIIKALSLPPASLCIALCIAIGVTYWRRRLGLGLLWAVLIVFYLLSAPFSSNLIARMVATVPPLEPSASLGDAQAIVVLSAGASLNGPEYGGVQLDDATLRRLRYAAHLYHRAPLPVLVTGGAEKGLPFSYADAMKQALEEDFAVPVKWVENKSVDTMENAGLSAPMLKDAGISSIVLVTSATHMPRSLALFEAQGFKVLAASTGFPATQFIFPRDVIPRMIALDQSETSIYELLAAVWHGLVPEKP